jgi:hypothetical protein
MHQLFHELLRVWLVTAKGFIEKGIIAPAPDGARNEIIPFVLAPVVDRIDAK